MSNRKHVVEYLKQGLTLDEIAHQLGITIGTVVNYLQTHVGQGTIKRSDIYFAIHPEIRKVLGMLMLNGITEARELLRFSRSTNFPIDKTVIDVYLQFRDARVAKGDTYEFIAEIETNLHTAIRNVLIIIYGDNEGGWWRKGIPTEIRQACHTIREADPEPAAEPFSYTTFIQLSKIIDKQWAIFSKVLPMQVVNDKKALLSDLSKLNRIRNGVMHPIKGIDLTEEDFELVRKFRDALELSRWDLPE